MICPRQAQKELKEVVKTYLLRQVSLDEALLESITRRDFDWNADMRRMLDTVKVSTKSSQFGLAT